MAATRTLRRRMGQVAIAVLAPNLIFTAVVIFSIGKLGFYAVLHSFWSYLLAFIILNLSPAYALWHVYRYKVVTDGTVISGSPLDGEGPLCAIHMDEIGTVDIRVMSELGIPTRGPAAIVLFPKEEGATAPLSIDPSRVDHKALKELIRSINHRCPGALTKEAKRYLDGPAPLPPREDRYGNFLWTP